jgi:hypothetical protein
MNIGGKLDDLIEFIYDIPQNTFKNTPRHGVSVSEIIASYNESHGIDFEDISIADIRLLLQNEWIEEAPPINPNDRPIFSVRTRIELTNAGIQHVENLRQPWLKKNWKNLLDVLAVIVRIFK